MKKLISSIITIAAASAFMYPIFSTSAQSNDWCSGVGYSVVRPDMFGNPQTITFNQTARVGYCKVLSKYQSLYPNG